MLPCQDFFFFFFFGFLSHSRCKTNTPTGLWGFVCLSSSALIGCVTHRRSLMSNGISHLALAAEQTFWVILTHFSFCVDQSCLVKGFFFHKQNICELLRKPLWPFLTLQVGVIDQLFSGKWMLMIKRSTWLSKDKCFLPVALWPLVKDIKGPTMCVCVYLFS